MFNNEQAAYLERLLSPLGEARAKNASGILSEKFDDLNYLLHVDSYVVKELVNPDNKTSEYLRLIAAMTSRRITDKFKNGKKYLQNELTEYIVGLFFGLTVETTYIIMLDENDKLISSEYLGDGTVNSSGFLPRKLLDVALRKNAKRVILAHNHPCGNAAASNNDIVVTDIAKTVLRDAGIELVAHYIVSGFDIEDCIDAIKPSVPNPSEHFGNSRNGDLKKFD